MAAGPPDRRGLRLRRHADRPGQRLPLPRQRPRAPRPCCAPRCASPLPSLRAAITGGTAADEVKEKLFHRLLGGVSVAELDRRSAVFAHRHLQRRLRADTRRRLEWHQRQGHYTVIVSASPECYVSPAGEELGVDGVVATRLAVGGGGLLTGGYEGKNCRGAEKYARLVGHLRSRGLLSNKGGEQPVLWAYGNSRGDLRLLNAADHGVDAGRLGPLGRLRRFPRLAEVAASGG